MNYGGGGTITPSHPLALLNGVRLCCPQTVKGSRGRHSKSLVTTEWLVACKAVGDVAVPHPSKRVVLERNWKFGECQVDPYPPPPIPCAPMPQRGVVAHTRPGTECRTG